MDCKTVREKLGEYMDGTAGPSDKAALDEHLSTCPKCSSALEELRKTVGRLGQLEDIEPPAWLTQTVMAKIREERQKTSLLRRLFYPLRVKVPIQAAATVLIAVVTLYIFRTMQNEVVTVGTMPGRDDVVTAEKGKDAGLPTTPEVQRPPLKPEDARRAPSGQTARPLEEDTGKKVLPERSYAPPPTAKTGEAEPVAKEKAVGYSAGQKNMERQKSAPETAAQGKALLSEAGRPQVAGALRRDEKTESENVPGPALAPLKKPEKALWSDYTITKEDIAKVVKAAVARETANELVFDVEYYLSDAFPGKAIVGIYPDMSGPKGGEAQALPGKHTVRISVSRLPSAVPGDSKNLSIEIVRQEDAARLHPLYRKSIPFVKRWGGD